jgi:CubicO group peptidase (beta-lactamase class C family)
MARFGLLLLNKGVWDGATILSDTQYFKQQTNSSQQINPSYGYLTWLNGKSSFMAPGSQIKFNGSLNPNAPNDMFCAWGKNGQYINVVPNQKLVLIRMGNAPGGSGSASMAVGFNNEIWQYMNRLPCKNNTVNFENPPFSIGPNPVKVGSDINITARNNQLNSTVKNGTVSIADNLGRIVIETPFNPSESTSLPINIKPGIYFIRISSNSHQGRSQRLLVIN